MKYCFIIVEPAACPVSEC